MENNNNTDIQTELPKKGKSIISIIFNFFNKRFKIFKRRWLDNIDMKLIIFQCGIIPMGIIYFFFAETNPIRIIYGFFLEPVYRIFSLVINQTTVISPNDLQFTVGSITTVSLTIISMGFFIYTLVELLKLCLALFTDIVVLIINRHDKEDSFYNNIK